MHRIVIPPHQHSPARGWTKLIPGESQDFPRDCNLPAPPLVAISGVVQRPPNCRGNFQTVFWNGLSRKRSLAIGKEERGLPAIRRYVELPIARRIFGLE